MRLGRMGPKEITVDVLRRCIEDAVEEGVEMVLLDGVQSAYAMEEQNEASTLVQDSHTNLIKRRTLKKSSRQ